MPSGYYRTGGQDGWIHLNLKAVVSAIYLIQILHNTPWSVQWGSFLLCCRSSCWARSSTEPACSHSQSRRCPLQPGWLHCWHKWQRSLGFYMHLVGSGLIQGERRRNPCSNETITCKVQLKFDRRRWLSKTFIPGRVGLGHSRCMTHVLMWEKKGIFLFIMKPAEYALLQREEREFCCCFQSSKAGTFTGGCVMCTSKTSTHSSLNSADPKRTFCTALWKSTAFNLTHCSMGHNSHCFL